MVQESTNTFSDGLIKDLNPLTTPNTVLTDALNATLLTFNGNELVLQNDLGNTKITGAKLPEGYIPLGIKEHGGILYIISSNGENVEIGSFPSPEMVNDSLDETDPLTLNIFIDSNDNKINKNVKLSSSSFKPGEKFLIILDTIQGGINNSTGESFISDYITRKIYKPKLISIANGVELDITDTLIQQKNIHSNPDYYSWFIDGNPSESDINLFKSEKITQIYKSRKSGDIYLRFDLESIDKFYLNNTVNNTSAYPVITKDEVNNHHLKFSFHIESNSYIKCNEIMLKYTLTDLTTSVNNYNTIRAKLAYPFIYGLTYGVGSIVYNNNSYYKALSLHSGEDVMDDSFWQNLGNYETAVIEEPLLKPYSLNNQYENIFDINFGDNRNKLINYEITPLNTLFDLSFDDFTITDNLDLSKDNISWVLSPYWSIIPDFYSCELESGEFGEQYTGYVLYNMIGRFGKDASGFTIELDSNDLPLQNNSKQAVLVRYGTSHIQYSNYNIIGYYSLDSNFRPSFSLGIIVQISEDEVFRKVVNGACESRVRINLTYRETLVDLGGTPTPMWPDWMKGSKAPTQKLQEAFKENYRFTSSASITEVYGSGGNLIMPSETSPYYNDFGVITITPKVRVMDERWDYNPSSGWKLASDVGAYIFAGFYNPTTLQLSNTSISTGDVSSTYTQSIQNSSATGGPYNAGVLYIRKLMYIQPYQLTYDQSKLLQAPNVTYNNLPDLPELPLP